MKIQIALAIAILCFVGCSKNTESNPAGEGGGGAASSAVAATDATFQTKDGWTIHSDYYEVPGAKGAVILLHQRGGSASDWRPLLFQLKKNKISALAIDQRGAGRSTGTQNGEDAPWDTSGDIAAGIGWLKGKGISSGHIGLAGASYGANNALIYAAKNPGTNAIALLSPGKDYHGLAIPAALSQYKGAILVLTATGDSVQEGGPDLIKKANPSTEVKTYDGDAHGTNLFRSHGDSIDAISAFFKSKL